MSQNKPWLDLYPDSIKHEISVSNVTMAEVLEQTVRKFPDHPAISFHEVHWTYTEFKEQVDTFASALQREGVGKGDRVALMLPTCPQYVVAYFGVLSVGGMVVQVNPQSVARELEYIMNDSKAETIITLDSLSPIVEEVKANVTLKNVIITSLGASEIDISKGQQSYESFIQKSTGKVEPVSIDPAEDTGVIQYTGGTTGRPKGVMLTHRNLVANIEQHDEVYKNTLTHGKERVLIVMPLFHSYGMTICMNLSILQGSCLILLEKFELDTVLETIKREKPTRFAGVPTMYVALNSHPKVEEYGINNIKLCHSGGAPLPLELTNEFERKTGAVICEAYGLSEATPGAISHAPFIKRNVGSVGIPLPSTDLRIVDLENGTEEVPAGELGEITLRGPQVMKGYLNLPEETTSTLRDGWLYTGDIGKRDKDGYVFIVDRKKEMIIASGYNIYPREVEEVLYEHPAVLEAAVIGVKDEYRGETVKAVLALREGKEVTEEEIMEHCKKNLSAYKVPKIVEFREELPKIGVGKILRRALRDEQKV